jgi:hypothetical protein
MAGLAARGKLTYDFVLEVGDGMILTGVEKAARLATACRFKARCLI